MTKPVRSFRLDPSLIANAEKLGINLTDFFEAALAKVVKEKKCPYCGSGLKKKALKD